MALTRVMWWLSPSGVVVLMLWLHVLTCMPRRSMLICCVQSRNMQCFELQHVNMQHAAMQKARCGEVVCTAVRCRVQGWCLW